MSLGGFCLPLFRRRGAKDEVDDQRLGHVRVLVAGDTVAFKEECVRCGDILDSLTVLACRASEDDGGSVPILQIEMAGVIDCQRVSGPRTIPIRLCLRGVGHTSRGGHERISVVLLITAKGVLTGRQGQHEHKGENQRKDLITYLKQKCKLLDITINI